MSSCSSPSGFTEIPPKRLPLAIPLLLLIATKLSSLIQIGKYLISDDLLEKKFICDLDACKGACCVAGDEGAILKESETGILDDIYEDVKEYLTPEGKEVLEKEGPYYLNEQGAPRTSLIDGKACAYTIFENGTAFCGIEKAWADGKTHFRKPVSCHLYPVREKDLGEFTALNYERWEICSPACDLGEKHKVAVYSFLEGALTRAYGEEFFQALHATAQHKAQQEGGKENGE